MITTSRSSGHVSHPLDNAARSALAGPHAGFARRRGQALRYPPDVSPIAALPADPDERAWHDLAVLTGPDGFAVLAGTGRTPPDGWTILGRDEGLQFDGSGLVVKPDPDAQVLGPDDVAEMLDLVARTRPGPFEARTCEMGTYLGVRRGGALVAMAGERLRPPGWSEISGVCTDPAHRGHGFASRLVAAVGAVIRERGDVPFLHTAAHNTAAVRLYEHLGFTLRQRTEVVALRPPADG